MRHNNHDGTFSHAENDRLTAFDQAHGLVQTQRPTLAEDEEELIRIHREDRCSWWHRGDGVLVRHRSDFHPAQVLVEHDV
jgi:hypothetical protein